VSTIILCRFLMGTDIALDFLTGYVLEVNLKYSLLKQDCVSRLIESIFVVVLWTVSLFFLWHRQHRATLPFFCRCWTRQLGMFGSSLVIQRLPKLAESRLTSSLYRHREICVCTFPNRNAPNLNTLNIHDIYTMLSWSYRSVRRAINRHMRQNKLLAMLYDKIYVRHLSSLRHISSNLTTMCTTRTTTNKDNKIVLQIAQSLWLRVTFS